MAEGAQAMESLAVDSQLLPADGGLSRPRAVKNLLTLGLSFMLMFTAYQGLAVIQSSINSEEGLGTAGLAVTYVSLTASSLALAPLVIGRLGAKWSMTVVMFGYLLYMCANLYPRWGTLIPASVLLGLCGAPLWAGMSVYTVRIAGDFARASGDRAAAASGGRTGSIFFGVFFTLFASSNVWGNLISYLTLSSHSPNATQRGNLSCGYRFCPAAASGSGSSQVEKPPMNNFYIMMGCFIAAAGLSILVMLLLVVRTDRDSDRRRFSLAQLCGNLRAMGAHMLDQRQLLLVILTVNVGLSQSFAFGDFTEGFVACTSGVASVGRVMTSYGAGLIASGLLFGQLAGLVGKLPVLLAAACVQVALESLALFWRAAAEPAWQLYAFAGVWGCVDTVWNSQMNALYGEYFPDKTDAAFSAYKFWESVGYIVGFSYNKLLCMEQKLHVMLAVVTAGAVGLVVSGLVNRRIRGLSNRIDAPSEPIKTFAEADATEATVK